ncbi:general secretion pathway protein GspB [Marinobacter sp. X15-166B]|uniref:general secretion pathway protein GspB n=1 Tax=Marinobacter sp. X15-166B TaxID=1897620 RepID=UPI00085BEDAF|nr:general secretion pathway protein GspB [Marinobacter sp. X15-166B]OEY67726.1 hypothetical protein BG841_15665 [Marinobacter sp. X15-166B]
MSYILEALRKSERERHQGRVPDFHQQVQMIHQPRRKSVPAVVWLALALVFNGVVMAVVFRPAPVADGAVSAPERMATVVAPAPQTQAAPAPETVAPARPTKNIEDSPAAVAPPPRSERPTVIVPSARARASAAQGGEPPASPQRVPHLVELPLSFQRSVPDLVFNSHVYASDPLARRVMINDHYLRAGDAFSGIRVDRITEEGVELSKNGKRFRVGVVRDWIAPR